MKSTVKDTRIEGLILLGQAAYGAGWQSPLARLLGCSPAMLGHLASGNRDLSKEMRLRIKQAIPTLEAKIRGEFQQRMSLLRSARTLILEPEELAAIMRSIED